mmetsp:Transcript_61096/g.90638  ORF Transcript_61096/g.90638 Transcript_61096/m.90638 type:complete len:100 (-) Transcript_61096:166-465(-)
MHRYIHVVAKGVNYLLNLLRQLTGRGEDEGLAVTQFAVQLSQGSDRESGGLTLSFGRKEIEKTKNTKFDREKTAVSEMGTTDGFKCHKITALRSKIGQI